MDTFGDKVWLEIIRAILAMLLLFVTWAAGQNIIAYWDLKKKRQENDLATANQFYQLYGEFRTLWRLWKAYKNHCQGDPPAISPPKEIRWGLLELILPRFHGHPV